MDNLFIEKIKELDEVLEKKRSKWLFSLGYMDFDDVCQMIRAHIYEKMHLYNPKKSFKLWASKVANNQIVNIIRNNYGKVAPPCNSLSCAHNGGGNICRFTPSGTKCSECPLYAKWEKKKKVGYDLKFAESIEELLAVNNLGGLESSDNFNLGESITAFHEKMKDVLPERLYFIYKILYIEGKPDSDLSIILGLKNNDVKTNSKRVAGYKQIYNYKEQIFTIAKEVLQDFDLIQ